MAYSRSRLAYENALYILKDSILKQIDLSVQRHCFHTTVYVEETQMLLTIKLWLITEGFVAIEVDDTHIKVSWNSEY